MQSRLANVLAPHYCISCGAIGAIFCERCIYDITSDTFAQCIKCLAPTQRDGLCQTCRLEVPYSDAWCVAVRDGAIAKLLDTYKFERTKSAYQVLARLLDGIVPMLPEDDTVVTSVPTIAPHVRRRGYDHAELIAKELARLRGLPYRHLLVRHGTTVQLGATKRQRREYASKAFGPKGKPSHQHVLLVDDVYTTGASVECATKALLSGGAKEVCVALIARQVLD